MTIAGLKKLKLPDTPGVYYFRDAKRKILYIGKATSLRSRVRSYFTLDIAEKRSVWIQKMTEDSATVTWTETESVLEAFILEAREIKKYAPIYNTRDKDDKSFNYVAITKETFPRVLIVRERDMYQQKFKEPVKYLFGPFPSGTSLKEALHIVRRIIPFRDRCAPEDNKPCFNHQIGLCPGVCAGEISANDYGRNIQFIKFFFEGKKKEIRKRVEKLMYAASEELRFEDAHEYKKMLFSLDHIRDVSLIEDEHMKAPGGFRIEAYDVAHTSGKQVVGVMTVIVGSEVEKSAYRKFRIKSFEGSDDTRALEELLTRRLGHFEWRLPNIIVVDGGIAQKRRAEKVLRELGVHIPVVAVTKDKRHKPKALQGNQSLIAKHTEDILHANAESHRFAVRYHRQLRDKIPKR